MAGGKGSAEEHDRGLVEDAINRMNQMAAGSDPDFVASGGAGRGAEAGEAGEPKLRVRARRVVSDRTQRPQREAEVPMPEDVPMPRDRGVIPPDDFDDDYGEGYGGMGGGGGMGNGRQGRFAAAGNWMQWGVMALIAIVITYAMVSWMVTSKGEIANMADQRIVNAITPMKTVENALRTDLDNLEAMAITTAKLADYAKKSDLSNLITAQSLVGYATVEQLEGYVKESDVAEFLTADVLEGYVTDSELEDMLEGTGAYEELAEDVAGLGASVTTLTGAATSLDARLDVIEAAGSSGTGSAGVAYSLTGTATDFKLKVKSPETGWYVGYVTLIYRTPPTLNAANNTYDGALVDFYGKLSDVGTRIYIPKMIAGTSWDVVHNKWVVVNWKLGEVTFFTSRFQLAAGVEKELALHIGGLNAFPGYEAYIDILESSVSSTETGGGSI